MRTPSLAAVSKVILALSFMTILSGVASAQCTARGDPAIAICTPTNGSTVDAPIHIQIGTNDSGATVDLLQVYYNQVKRWENHVSNAEFYLQTFSGPAMRITAVAHDTLGRWFQTTVNVTISSSVYLCLTEQNSNQQPHSVLFCQPTDGQIADSPVHTFVSTKPASGLTIQGTELYVDGVRTFRQRGTGSFNGLYATQPFALGRHRVTAQGYDATGSFSQTIYVKVGRVNRGCEPPSVMPAVEICGPVDGSTVSNPVEIKASAAATVGIQSIRLFVDGVQKYDANLSAVIDYKNSYPSGTHQALVRATDTDGHNLERTISFTVP
jgi:hypothetical protein